MATLHGVEATILAQVNGAVTGLTFNNLPITVQAGIGWPPEKLLQNNVRGSTSVISIYDRKMSRNSTRWKPIITGTTSYTASVTSELSVIAIPPGGNATLTLGGVQSLGDAVSLVVGNNSLQNTQSNSASTIQSVGAQVVSAGSSDTTTSMAQNLATQINADPLLSLWLSASASGPIITLTSKLAYGALSLQSNVGSGGFNIREIGRRDRVFQIVIWSPTTDIRTVLTSAIEVMLQQAELNFMLTLPDGTVGRLFNQNDFDLEDASLADTYRHDFIFSVDYPITEQDAVFAVLAPVPAWQIQ